ncbi:UvrD-helicase domain-containing protein [Sphingomonas azotifigens]|uniref:UvrD-helicase domain-containing protein n=1 Tax=Sphingomonas azotifigens TaxID=330920 RepID=UPI000A036680|nr:UvrD-helicase domain-containing protein [Sphingomonas azotifigens]
MTDVHDKIVAAIQAGQSFLLDAGAGAGKTYSLVEALRHLLATRRQTLVRSGQTIACITFTNVAKDEIAERIGHDPLVGISTIHDFLWDVLVGHQRALRRAVAKYNDGLKATSSRRKDPAELAAALPTLTISYSDRGSNLLKGRLHHDDLLGVARIVFADNPLLSKLIAAKFPFLFVDEYQDTSRAVVDVLLGSLLPNSGGALVLGLFGDKMQNIYHGGEHPGVGEIPADYAALLTPIVKSDNRRCSLAVIALLNCIRTDIEQVPADNNAVGSVVYVHPATGDAAGLEQAQQYLRETLHWPAEIKELYLTHRLIGRKAGYGGLLEVYGARGGFHRERLVSGDDDIIDFMMTRVEPVATAWEKGSQGQTVSLLKRHGHVLASNASKAASRAALDTLLQVRGAGTIGDVLTHLRTSSLIAMPEELALRVDGGQLDLAGLDAEAADRENRDRAFYAGLFALPYCEVTDYTAFFEDHTPYATKHGVKGAEFDDVAVILDDAGANWNLYSFTKYLNGEDKVSNEKRWSRSRNIFYVCCSRAKRNLAVIDLAPRSNTKDNGVASLFGPDACHFL